jgi:hypothetical protein
VSHFFFERWKPAARARTQVFLAALLWTFVGTGLSVAGLRWCAETQLTWSAFLVLLGVVLGLLKGRFALERTARRSSARIARRGDGKCLGGFLSWKSWLFVLAMVLTGAVLRRSGIPRSVLGVLYTAVGSGLLWGSRVYWGEWWATS